MTSAQLQGRLLLLALQIALAAGLASAQSSEQSSGQPPGGITLGEAREAALRRSRTVAQAEAALRARGYDQTVALSSFFPSLSARADLSGAVADDGSVGLSPAFTFSAKQTLFSGLSRVTALRSASASTALAAEALRAARLQVIEETDTRFLDALKAARNYQTAQKNLEAAQKSLDIAAAKKEVGAIAESDFLAVQSSWASSQTALVQTRYAAEASARKLAAYTGSAAPPLPLDDSSIDALAATVKEKAEADPDAFSGKLYAASRDANPDIRQAELQASIAQLSVSSSQADFFPTLSVSANFVGSSPDTSSAYGYSKSFGVSASIPLLPLVDRVAKTKADQARSDSAQLFLAAAEDDLRLTLYTTTLSALSASGQIASAEAALAYAEQNYKLALERFRLSSGTSSSLATAEATLVSARAQAVTSRFDLYAALTALVRLSGAETEEEFRDALR